jgi:excisionase family DNA binding protein
MPACGLYPCIQQNVSEREGGRTDEIRRMEMLAEITREWVTYRQAEELSGLSRTTLWKLLSAGEIKAARVGRAVRISRRSLDGYLERAAEGS